MNATALARFASSLLGASALALAPSCKKEAPPAPPAATSAAGAPMAVTKHDRIERLAFNRRVAELDLPLFWTSDANGDKSLDPAELAVLWRGVPSSRLDWVETKGAFTPKFEAAYEAATKPMAFEGLTPDERKRRESVALELSQGRPTLFASDFSSAPPAHRTLVSRLLRVAALVERLHMRQKGTLGLDAEIPSGDTLSSALFFRNQGPFCAAPKTERDPDCNALPQKPKPVVGLYPSELQADPKFCAKLEQAKNAKELTGHFSVVVAKEGTPGAYEAVKYSQAYRDDMQAVAKELEETAAVLGDDEVALKKYLVAAAAAFRGDDWESADEAWAAMNAQNSKYYLRVAPDEVYYEPCAWKAGFALVFARINQDSLAWQTKLEPVKQEMEATLAALAGPPYKARTVGFKLPDFIDIVANAGDSRAPHGGTIGQSLPNWGRVAEKGGRTVMMTNLTTDADSRASGRAAMASLFCVGTMAKVRDTAKPDVMAVVLHEAAHNLGPSHDYKVNGKEDDAVFGGPLASTFEELKAQTAALYFPGWLVEKKLISQDEADESRLRDVAWGFGHVSRGMYDADGKPKNYSQLASIQLAHLQKASVLEWKPGDLAANGSDKGCFDVHLERWQPAVEALGKLVLGIKSRGDKAGAEKLVASYVDAKGAWAELRKTIAERWLRSPRATFVYSIRE
jgi:hypothetical protein